MPTHNTNYRGAHDRAARNSCFSPRIPLCDGPGSPVVPFLLHRRSFLMSNPIHRDDSEPSEFRPPSDAFLCGPATLPYAREHGSLLHIRESMPLSFLAARCALEHDIDGVEACWMPSPPEWPAFAVAAAFAAALESGQSVCILSSSALCTAVAADTLVDLSDSLESFELRCTEDGGLLLLIAEGVEPFSICIRRVATRAFWGKPWLPASLRGSGAPAVRLHLAAALGCCEPSVPAEGVLEEARVNLPGYLTTNCSNLAGSSENE